jgi:serralysin
VAELILGGSAASPQDRDFDLRLGSLTSGTVTTKTSTTLIIDRGGGFATVITGVDLTYDSAGKFDTGTITKFELTLNGGAYFTLQGFAFDAHQFSLETLTTYDRDFISGALFQNDTVTGNSFGDNLAGFTGHDNISGFGGADYINGGNGNDHLYGHSATGGSDDGNDTIYGGEGSDYIQGNAGEDYISGDEGSDRIQGGKGSDTIYGGEGNDTVNGNLNNDKIYGGSGHDSLRGGQGDDYIEGSSGNDTLLGDLGRDTLIGGQDFDLLIGGGDSDLFDVQNAGLSRSTSDRTVTVYDTIGDYTDGVDHIDVGYSASFVLSGSISATSGGTADIYRAYDAAVALLNGRADSSSGVVAIGVGNDTYLFYDSASNGSFFYDAVKVAGVAPSVFDTTDFIS